MTYLEEMSEPFVTSQRDGRVLEKIGMLQKVRAAAEEEEEVKEAGERSRSLVEGTTR